MCLKIRLSTTTKRKYNNRKGMKIVYTKQPHNGSEKPFFGERLSDRSAWFQKMKMPQTQCRHAGKCYTELKQLGDSLHVNFRPVCR